MAEFIVQKFHRALQPDQYLTVASSGRALYSAQGTWDSGCSLHCLAMAGALLGRLSDTRLVSWRRRGREGEFWNRVSPYYLTGATMKELATITYELDWGLRPILAEGSHKKVIGFCEEQLLSGRLVILSWRPVRATHQHAALALGVEGRQTGRSLKPNTLLLLDPAESEPWLTVCNARLNYRLEASGKFTPHGTYVTTHSRSSVVVAGALSIQPLSGSSIARKIP